MIRTVSGQRGDLRRRVAEADRRDQVDRVEIAQRHACLVAEVLISRQWQLAVEGMTRDAQRVRDVLSSRDPLRRGLDRDVGAQGTPPRGVQNATPRVLAPLARTRINEKSAPALIPTHFETGLCARRARNVSQTMTIVGCELQTLRGRWSACAAGW